MLAHLNALVSNPCRKISAGLFAVAVVSSLAAPKAHAIDLIGSLVTNYNGPTYSLASFSLVATTTDFNINSGTLPVTVNPPVGSPTMGSLHLNIALNGGNFDPTQENGSFTNQTGDFLSLQVGVPTQAPVFESNMAVDFGTVTTPLAGGGTQVEDWFAFYSSGTTAAPQSDLIGGYMFQDFPTTGHPSFTDVKLFAIANPAPLPSSAIGGGLLMSSLAGWQWVRRHQARKAGLV